jgi:hypothetical protein
LHRRDDVEHVDGFTDPFSFQQLEVIETRPADKDAETGLLESFHISSNPDKPERKFRKSWICFKSL